jgi:type III pantothenate kinase
MRPDIVADIGNSFIKWGRCAGGAIVEQAYLHPDHSAEWQAQREAWGCSAPATWAVAGVHPSRRDALVKWLRSRGDTVLLLDLAAQLPLHVQVDHPARVGIDRLLDAVAANALRRPETPAIIIDAGSAVTVDWVDARGAFGGGSILPGLRLMAESLHDYTALLPLLQVHEPAPLPARSTTTAMQAGIFWAVSGGIRTICERLADGCRDVDVFLTGGDAGKLEASLRDTLPAALARALRVVPLLTLEGVRLSAEARA